MNNDKLIRLSSAVDLCMNKAKFYQPEMFGSDQECFTAKLVATELAGEIRNLPPVEAETHIKKLEEKYKRAMENAKILSDAVTHLEREMDALLHDLSHGDRCQACVHTGTKPGEEPCATCWKVPAGEKDRFVWRGLCKENGGISDED